MKIQRDTIYKISLLIFSFVVTISFLLPTVYIMWLLPGEDMVGNPIIIDISESFSMLQLIPNIGNWIAGWTIIFPLMDVISVLAYALLFVLKSLNFSISTKVLIVLLIYPLIVSFFSLGFFTIFGLGVLISEIVCIILLTKNPSLVFINPRRHY